MVKIAWYQQNSQLPSHIHLTQDGKETVCGGHSYYIEHRQLTQVPHRHRGESLYCKICFAYIRSKQRIPWDIRCIYKGDII